MLYDDTKITKMRQWMKAVADEFRETRATHGDDFVRQGVEFIVAIAGDLERDGMLTTSALGRMAKLGLAVLCCDILQEGKTMSCPTCEHTMQNLGLAQSGAKAFWCPRCGTLKLETPGDEPLSSGHADTEVPSLVHRIHNAVLLPCEAGVIVPLQMWRDIDEAAGLWKQKGA